MVLPVDSVLMAVCWTAAERGRESFRVDSETYGLCLSKTASFLFLLHRTLGPFGLAMHLVFLLVCQVAV
jgi:hypothetical protein